MLKNYFITALRSLWKNRVFTTINIIGLTIGLSTSLVIYLLVKYDFSYNKGVPDGNRIYRVVTHIVASGEVYRNGGLPVPLAHTAPKEITGLEAAAAFWVWNDMPDITIPSSTKEKELRFRHQDNIILADGQYFRVFPYQWVAGSAATALNAPFQVVLSTSAVEKYFPGKTMTSIIGSELLFNDTIRTVVTGIVKDLPYATDLPFTTFVSRATYDQTRLQPEGWQEWASTNSSSQLFIKLATGSNAAAVEKKVNEAYNRHFQRDAGENIETVFYAQPLSELHFTDYDKFGVRSGHRPTLYGLIAIALFLLALACINFINLTTAQSAGRAREIGIRKTLGGSRGQLVLQFLVETFALTLLAVLLSVLLAPLLLRAFPSFIPAAIHFSPVTQPHVLIFLLALTLSVSLFAGLYPALVLSGHKPILVLKNQLYATSGQSRTAYLRRTLTISQFVVAQVFIIGTLMVSKQINFSMHKDIGSRKDGVLVVYAHYDKSRTQLLAERLRRLPGVAQVSLSSSTPSSRSTYSSIFKYYDGQQEKAYDVHIKMGDTAFLQLYQIKLLAGRLPRTSDTLDELLINETYAHRLGFSEPGNAVGRHIVDENIIRPIVGVVADFNQASLHQEIKPLAIGNAALQYSVMNILLQPQKGSGKKWAVTIEAIQQEWNAIFPGEDFNYKFYNESLAAYYNEERKVSTLLIWASALTIVISCLGLLGLVSYTTHQRTKEIGVRKILGASVTQLVALLSKDLVKLVILAFLLAVPIAWWGVQEWLQRFAYRTTLSWWVFLASGMLMLLIALVILGARTIKAAQANPVISLRTE